MSANINVHGREKKRPLERGALPHAKRRRLLEDKISFTGSEKIGGMNNWEFECYRKEQGCNLQAKQVQVLHENSQKPSQLKNKIVFELEDNLDIKKEIRANKSLDTQNSQEKELKLCKIYEEKESDYLCFEVIDENKKLILIEKIPYFNALKENEKESIFRVPLSRFKNRDIFNEIIQRFIGIKEKIPLFDNEEAQRATLKFIRYLGISTQNIQEILTLEEAQTLNSWINKKIINIKKGSKKEKNNIDDIILVLNIISPFLPLTTALDSLKDFVKKIDQKYIKNLFKYFKDNPENGLNYRIEDLYKAELKGIGLDPLKEAVSFFEFLFCSYIKTGKNFLKENSILEWHVVDNADGKFNYRGREKYDTHFVVINNSKYKVNFSNRKNYFCSINYIDFSIFKKGKWESKAIFSRDDCFIIVNERNYCNIEHVNLLEVLKCDSMRINKMEYGKINHLLIKDNNKKEIQNNNDLSFICNKLEDFKKIRLFNDFLKNKIKKFKGLRYFLSLLNRINQNLILRDIEYVNIKGSQKLIINFTNKKISFFEDSKTVIPKLKENTKEGFVKYSDFLVSSNCVCILSDKDNPNKIGGYLFGVLVHSNENKDEYYIKEKYTIGDLIDRNNINEWKEKENKQEKFSIEKYIKEKNLIKINEILKNENSSKNEIYKDKIKQIVLEKNLKNAHVLRFVQPFL